MESELFLKAEAADLGNKIHRQFTKEEVVCHLNSFFRRFFNIGNSYTYTHICLCIDYRTIL